MPQGGHLSGGFYGEVILSNVSFYVRQDGSNTNDGLANTPQRAFKTIQYAIDRACSILNLYSKQIRIEISGETYNEYIVLKGHLGDIPYVLNGAPGAKISSAGNPDATISAYVPSAKWMVSNLEIRMDAGGIGPSGYESSCVWVSGGASVELFACKTWSSAGTSYQVQCRETGSKIKFTFAHAVDGDTAFAVIAVYEGGYCDLSDVQFQMLNTPSMTRFLAVSVGSNCLAMNNNTSFSYVGASTGIRAYAGPNSSIWRTGVTFPGNAAEVVSGGWIG